MSSHRPFKAATIGGTFNVMHEGHIQYINLALAVADLVYVGITSDEYAAREKKSRVRRYSQRKNQVIAFLERASCLDRTLIYELRSEEDLRSTVLRRDIDVAVVESRYLELLRTLSDERRRAGAHELCIVLKPRTLENGVELSSTRLLSTGAASGQK